MAHPDIELLNTVYPAVPAVDLPKSGGGLARFVDADDYLPLSGGTITGNLDVDGDVSFSGNVTIADKAAWRNELGIYAHGTFTEMTSNMNLTTQFVKVPLKTFSGVGCSASSNGIKVDNAGIYIASGGMYFSTGFTIGDYVHIRIIVNSANMFDQIDRVSSIEPYTIYQTMPVILNLQADDVVYLYVQNETASRGRVITRVGLGLQLWQIG